MKEITSKNTADALMLLDYKNILQHFTDTLKSITNHNHHATNNINVSTGKVYLVGAGPGASDLITVRGLHIIRIADVIMHDRLVHTDLLTEVKSNCLLIDVGKRAGAHKREQSHINKLMVDYACKGLNVCRLKGGDPFVFGRGGEEINYLKEQGVEFEIVPGLSAATAVPSALGLPLTQRGYSSSFQVIAGYEDPQKSVSEIDWQDVATTTGTLIFMMPTKQLQAICQKLIALGKASNTKAAIISRGTMHDENLIKTTLQQICDRTYDNSGIKSPTMLVVGNSLFE